LAFRLPGTARLQSRHQRSLTSCFPEVCAAVVEQLPSGTVVDGELTVVDQGRFDFPALLRRLSSSRSSGKGPPASYVVFDVLAIGGEDVRHHPYLERRMWLLDLLAGASPPLATIPMTTDATAARVWLSDHLTAGVEGVVAKRLDHAYLPHLRSWKKVRARSAVDAVVVAVVGPPAAPAALVLGRPDNRGQLRVVGRTAAIPTVVRSGIGELLQPGDEHPGLAGIARPYRFGHGDSSSVTPVKPALVVEVAADSACDHGTYRHPLPLRRVRADLRPTDLRP
jgi:ATP-dependent DNA ligase